MGTHSGPEAAASNANNGGRGFQERMRRIRRLLRKAHTKRLIVFLTAVLLVFFTFAFALFLFVYDAASSGKIFKGVTVDGEPVGGMSVSSAARLISEEIAPPYYEPLTLVHEEEEFTLDPKDIDYEVEDVKTAGMALWTGRNQMLLTRMLRRLGGKPFHVEVPHSYSYDGRKLQQFVARLADDLDRSPRSATIDVSGGSPEIIDEEFGIKVDEEETKQGILKALSTGTSRLEIKAESIKPEITAADIGYIIIVSLSQHTLYLYDREELVNSYLVAVGSDKYPTPEGKFHVTYKEEDPTWLPISDWAEEKQGIPQPPGPDNPLGKYWIDIGSGIGIHATPWENTLGESVSHGCIRMATWAAEEVYERVELGTPVFIVS